MDLRNIILDEGDISCWVWKTPTDSKIRYHSGVVINEGKTHLLTCTLTTLHVWKTQHQLHGFKIISSS